MRMRVYLGNPTVFDSRDVWREEQRIMRGVNLGPVRYDSVTYENMRDTRMFGDYLSAVQDRYARSVRREQGSVDYDLLKKKAFDRARKVFRRNSIDVLDTLTVDVVPHNQYLSIVQRLNSKINQLIPDSEEAPLPEREPPIYGSFAQLRIVIPDRYIMHRVRSDADQLSLLFEYSRESVLDTEYLAWDRKVLEHMIFNELAFIVLRESRGEAGISNAIPFIAQCPNGARNGIKLVNFSVVQTLFRDNYPGLETLFNRRRLWTVPFVQETYLGIRILEESLERPFPEDLCLPDVVHGSLVPYQGMARVPRSQGGGEIFVDNRGVYIPTYAFSQDHPTYNQRSARFEELFPGLYVDNIDVSDEMQLAEFSQDLIQSFVSRN